MDSTDIQSRFVTPHGLECLANTCRSEVALGGVVLKKVFKCNNGIIGAVHYDFYYDSLSPGLRKRCTNRHKHDRCTKFGDHNSIYNSGTMKTYSWLSHKNTIDLNYLITDLPLQLEKIVKQKASKNCLGVAKTPSIS